MEFQKNYSKLLKDDVIKVLHSLCQQLWKTQQWPQGASQGASEKSGILRSWDASLRTPLGFMQWKRS